MADKAYDSRSFREWLRGKGIPANDPPDRAEKKASQTGEAVSGGRGLPGAVESGEALCLVGTVPQVAGASQAFLEVFRGFALVAFILTCLRRF